MSYQFAIHADALADIEAAAAWYDEQRPGLGADFARAVRQTINTLPLNPLIYSLRERLRQVRWCFPGPISVSNRVSVEG